MYVGSAALAPRKFSPVTGRDIINGQHYLSALSDGAPVPFPPDLADAIRAEFAPGKFGKVTYPAWYKNTGLYSGVIFTDVSQGATPDTGYLSYRVLNRNGVKLWEVKNAYKLNEGMQFISPAMAAAAGGMQIPGMFSQGSTCTTCPPLPKVSGNYLFVQDPRGLMPIGQVGQGYTGGASGKSITMKAVKGIAMTVLPVVAGVVAAPLIFGAAGAGAGAGTAVAVAAPEAIAPGAIAVTTGAPVVTASVAPAVVAASVAPAAVATGGGILGTGITAAQAGAVLSAAKAAYSLATQHGQNAQQAAASGDIPLANQNAGMAVQYQQQGDSLMNTLNQPTVGGLPLWVLALGAIAAKMLLF